MRSDQINLLALCRVKGLSWYLIAREASRSGGLQRLLRPEFTEKTAETTKAIRAVTAALPKFDELCKQAEAEISLAGSEGIRLTTVLDEDYPLNLRMIFNLPPFLFYRGELKEDQDVRSVAVVGTRKATPHGLKLAAQIAHRLAERGITVLSGLARGIDTRAHEAALGAGGRTVSVLGSGLHKIYPPENQKLAEKIAETGALVSQFWLDAPPATYSFPRRNVTMSGMGQGTVVIEASATSGAKMQARLALEHGKKVFLVKSLVTNQQWAKDYLKRGAIEVGSVDHIIQALLTPEEIKAKTEQARQLSFSLA